jgi:hypothetical protein
MGWEIRYKLVAAAVREGKTPAELIAREREKGKNTQQIADTYGVYRNAILFWERKGAEKVIPEVSK